MFRLTDYGFFSSGNKPKSFEAGGKATDNLSNMERLYQEAEKESHIWEQPTLTLKPIQAADPTTQVKKAEKLDVIKEAKDQNEASTAGGIYGDPFDSPYDRGVSVNWSASESTS